MKDQLRLLEDLQRFDARLQEHDNALKNLPEKLQTLKNDLAKVEALLAKERQQLADSEKFRRDSESNLKADEQNVAKSKAKLSQVKTGKDHMAAQRETENMRKMVGEREEELIKLVDAIAAYKKNVETHEKDVAELRGHVDKEEAATNARMAEITQKTAGERAERDAVAARIRADLMKKYNHVRQRRGVAVVPVVGGSCQGCHMKIPPQLYNILQRASTIETCPNCNRIVYWDQIMIEKTLEAGEK